MLRAYGIDKAAASLLALHQHNEAQAAQLVIKRLQEGQRVACVSDAGTPGISDPGACLVAAVRDAGHPVVPLPGASSVTTALSVAGVHGGFAFIGFLPTKASERQAAIATLSTQTCATVLLEAPHRMAALAKALAVLDARLVTVGRELTKQFEEIATLPAHALSAWLQTSAHRLQGEFVLVLHPSATPQENRREQQVLQLLLAELPLKTAVKLAADITGSARNTLYQAALALQKQAAP
jgi:16S rRNA (cytidine1402-2'-O)-methyltransferase